MSWTVLDRQGLDPDGARIHNWLDVSVKAQHLLGQTTARWAGADPELGWASIGKGGSTWKENEKRPRASFY